MSEYACVDIYFDKHCVGHGSICDAIKQNESEVEKIDFFFLLFFWHFLLGYCLGFNLVKPPQRFGNWFQRYKRLKD